MCCTVMFRSVQALQMLRHCPKLDSSRRTSLVAEVGRVGALVG